MRVVFTTITKGIFYSVCVCVCVCVQVGNLSVRLSAVTVTTPVLIVSNTHRKLKSK